MNAINIFGIGAALIGLGGTGIAIQACREALAIPRAGGNFAHQPVIAAMIFIVLVDLVIIGLGVTVALVRI